MLTFGLLQDKLPLCHTATRNLYNPPVSNDDPLGYSGLRCHAAGVVPRCLDCFFCTYPLSNPFPGAILEKLVDRKFIAHEFIETFLSSLGPLSCRTTKPKNSIPVPRKTSVDTRSSA